MKENGAHGPAENRLPYIDGIQLTGEPIIGSTQVLYPAQYEHMTEPAMIAQTTDGGSVFDVGTIFEIPQSGTARNTLRHRLFSALADPVTWQEVGAADVAACVSDQQRQEQLLASPLLAQLKREGMPTHHLGLIHRQTGQVINGPSSLWSDLVLVQQFPVVKPGRTALLGTLAYDYHDYFQADSKVMALEHIARLGNPGGSSLQDRHDRLYALGDEAGAQALLAHYGVQPPLRPWTSLPNLTFDWTTKYEAHDRHLSLQEALQISGVPAATLSQTIDLLSFGTVYANKYFARCGLRLWDMKWEVAVDNGWPVVADTIDHDSIRITAPVEYQGKTVHIHFNKQAVRDYFRIFHTDWHRALNDAKRRAALQGNNQTFIEIYQQGVAESVYPPIPQLDPAFAQLQQKKYEFVAQGGHAAQYVTRTAQDIGLAEVHFYHTRGQLEAFVRRNAADTV